MTELLKTIRERKSVRTFDGRPVSAEDREKIEQYIRTIENPFGVPVRFVLLDAFILIDFLDFIICQSFPDHGLRIL